MTPYELVDELRPVMNSLATFYSPEESVVWLISPQVQLQGRIALDLIREGKTDQVMGILKRLEECVYL